MANSSTVAARCETKKDVYEKSRLSASTGRTFSLSLEVDGKIETLLLEEGQICWEGLRKLHGTLVRGVPRRNKKDCIKYCSHEGCSLI